MSVLMTVDPAKAEAFTEKVMLDFAGASACYLGAVGDALGLLRILAAHGSATSAELAQRAGVEERHTREWLAGVHAAGYLTFDRDGGRYVLPPEHAPALAEEGNAMFFGAAFRDIVENGETFAPLPCSARAAGSR